MEEQDRREEELAQREAALLARERAMKAREALMEAGLPQALAAHLDLSSDEALDKSLALAREARRHQPPEGPGTPKAGKARAQAPGGYAQRALLYQADRNDYLEQYIGER